MNLGVGNRAVGVRKPRQKTRASACSARVSSFFCRVDFDLLRRGMPAKKVKRFNQEEYCDVASSYENEGICV